MIIIPFRSLFLPVALEIADQFLLLCVNGYDGLVFLHEFHCSIVDVRVLLIVYEISGGFFHHVEMGGKFLRMVSCDMGNRGSARKAAVFRREVRVLPLVLFFIVSSE